MKPVLQALVLAEHVYQDKTGKHIIAGTFNALQLKEKTPAQTGTGERPMLKGGQPGSPYAYISLTDVCNGTKLTLQFISLTRNHVIFETHIEVECFDRLATVEIVAALPHLSVSEPGVYAFEVVCEEEVIGSHRIVAKPPI